MLRPSTPACRESARSEASNVSEPRQGEDRGGLQYSINIVGNWQAESERALKAIKELQAAANQFKASRTRSVRPAQSSEVENASRTEQQIAAAKERVNVAAHRRELAETRTHFRSLGSAIRQRVNDDISVRRASILAEARVDERYRRDELRRLRENIKDRLGAETESARTIAAAKERTARAEQKLNESQRKAELTSLRSGIKQRIAEQLIAEREQAKQKTFLEKQISEAKARTARALGLQESQQRTQELKALRDNILARYSQPPEEKRSLMGRIRDWLQLHAAQSKANESANRIAFTFRRLFGILAAFYLVRQTASAFLGFIKSMATLNTEIEQAQFGIASLLLAVGKVDDAFGGTVSQARAFSLAQAEARNQVALLRQDALKTTAAFEELVTAFQNAIAPGLTAGLKIDEIREFSVRIAQAGQAIGLQRNQLAEEIRSILQGTIQARTTRIAVALGITNEDIRKAKEAGKLSEYLRDKFAAFATAGEEVGKTFNGLATRIRNVFALLTQQAGFTFFEKLKGLLKQIYGTLTTEDPISGLVKPSEKAVQLIQAIADGLSGAVDAASELVKKLSFDDFLKVAEAVKAAFIAIPKVIAGIFQGLFEGLGDVLRIAQWLMNLLNRKLDLFDLSNVKQVAEWISRLLVYFMAVKIAVSAINVLFVQTKIAVVAWVVVLNAAKIALMSLKAINLGSIALGFQGATGAAAAFRAVLLSISAHPVIAGLVVLGLAISGIVAYTSSAKRSTEDLVQSMESSRASLEGQKESSGRLIERLTELAAKQALTNSEMSEASNIISLLKGRYGELGLSVDATAKKINGLAEAHRKVQELENAAEAKLLKGQKSDLEATIKKKEKEISDLNVSIEKRQRDAANAGKWEGPSFHDLATLEADKKDQINNQKDLDQLRESLSLVDAKLNVKKEEQKASESITEATQATSNIVTRQIGQTKSLADSLREVSGIVASQEDDWRNNTELVNKYRSELKRAKEQLAKSLAGVGLTGTTRQMQDELAKVQEQASDELDRLDEKRQQQLQTLSGLTVQEIRNQERLTAFAKDNADLAKKADDIRYGAKALANQTDKIAAAKKELEILRAEYTAADNDLALQKDKAKAILLQKQAIQSLVQEEEQLNDSVNNLLKGDNGQVPPGAEELVRLVKESILLQAQQASAERTLEAIEKNRRDITKEQVRIYAANSAARAVEARDELQRANDLVAVEEKHRQLVQESIDRRALESPPSAAPWDDIERVREQSAVTAKQIELDRQLRANNIQNQSQTLEYLVAEGASQEDINEILRYRDELIRQDNLEYQRENRLLQNNQRQLQYMNEIAERPVTMGIATALAQLKRELPTTFSVALETTRAVVDGFSTFVSDSIAAAFDPNNDKSLKERFADFLNDIGRLIIELMVKLAVIRASLGAFGMFSASSVDIASLALAGAHNGGPASHPWRTAKGYAAGGRPSGLHPSDTIPIWTAPGEWIIRAASVKRYGQQVMEAINRGLVDPLSLRALASVRSHPITRPVQPGFASGGLISEQVRSLEVASSPATTKSSPTPAVIVADEQAMDRLLAGGGNALIRYLTTHRTRMRAAIGL